MYKMVLPSKNLQIRNPTLIFSCHLCGSMKCILSFEYFSIVPKTQNFYVECKSNWFLEMKKFLAD